MADAVALTPTVIPNGGVVPADGGIWRGTRHEHCRGSPRRIPPLAGEDASVRDDALDWGL